MSSKSHSLPLGARSLQAEGVSYTEHLYEYVDKGGTENAARQLEVDEHAVIKTLVFQDEAKNPLIILMHGDKHVSTKNLARQVGVKRIHACSPQEAHRHTGYQVGGISPFGTKKSLPVFAERTLFDLDRIYINGGRKGFLVGIDPCDLERILNPVRVSVGA